MDTNKMREQFEKWALGHFVNLFGEDILEKDFGGDYVQHNVRIAWVGWKNSREAVVVELGAPSHWVADYAACGGGMAVFGAEKAAKVTDPMCSKTPSYTIHALEKAGLKVAP